MYNERPFIIALTEMTSSDFDDLEWLKDNFELYKSTLNWPPNLPPIKRTDLVEGTFTEKFHFKYTLLLDSYEHKFDNKLQSLKIENARSSYRITDVLDMEWGRVKVYLN